MRDSLYYNPYTTSLLSDATSPEGQLKLIFANMGTNKHQHEVLRCISDNIDIFKELLATKYCSKRQELGESILQALLEYPEFHHCLEIFFEDVFAYLRDYTAKVLKADKNDGSSYIFSYYCSEDLKFEQRAAREIEQLSEDNLQENPENWFTLAALASVLRTGTSFFWPIGYALNDKTITKTLKTLLIEFTRDADTATENYEIFMIEIINQFYERADILEEIDTLLMEDYGDFDVVSQTKKLQSCSSLQAKSFWKRLAQMYSSRDDKSLLSEAIIHLYSLCSIVDDPSVLAHLTMILEQEKSALPELASIVQEIVDNLLLKDPSSVPQNFIVASLYYFYELEHDQLARHIKSEIELAFKYDSIHSIVPLINRVFDLLICDELFTEDNIFDLILVKLKLYMERHVEVSYAHVIFKKIAVYCSKLYRL